MLPLNFTPIRGYAPRVRLFDGEKVVGDVTTTDATYEFADVPAPAGGSLRLRVNYPADGDRFVEQDVPVTAGQTLTRDFTLPLSGIAGTVTFWDGTPPPYGYLEITFGSGDSAQTFFADIEATGHYGVFDVPTGDFAAVAWVDSLNTTAVGTVQNTSDVATIDIVFGRITGTVRYADGTPVSRPTVFATQTLRPGLTVTYTADIAGADGSYEVIGPQPGTVTVTADNLMLEGTTTGTLVAGSPSGTDIAANISLEADGVVTGIVRDADDVPVVGGVPVALWIDGLDRTATTDASGHGSIT